MHSKYYDVIVSVLYTEFLFNVKEDSVSSLIDESLIDEYFIDVDSVIKKIVDEGFSYLLTNSYLAYVVKNSIGTLKFYPWTSNENYINIRKKVKENIINKLSMLLENPLDVISELSDYIMFKFQSIFGKTHYVSKEERDFIEVYDKELEQICKNGNLHVTETAFLASIMNRIYGYCLYYKKEEEFFSLIKPIKEEPKRYIEEVMINVRNTNDPKCITSLVLCYIENQDTK